MQTIILSINNESARDKALALLRNHEVLIAPTDTVYGVMCRYDSSQAVRRLFHVKQRPTDKAIPVLIGELEQLSLVAVTPLPPVATILAERFWPGPLTLVLPAQPHLPDELTADGDSVGIRMPDHDSLRALIRSAGPLAATSANRSGDLEACTAAEAQAFLGGLVPLILSDDDTTNRPHQSLPSTVVDLSGADPKILRPGPIAEETLDILQRHGYAPC